MAELRGLGDGAIIDLGNGIAFQDINEPTYNNVLWWHICADRGIEWAAAGLGAHIVKGSVAKVSLTVEGSLLCKMCGRHGFLESMKWKEA
jgi:hypothetical protein